MRHVIGAMFIAGLAMASGPGLAQTPPPSNAVKPNSQNLLQGPSVWTPQQRKLSVPGAETNPTMRQQGPFQRTAPVPVNPPPKPII